MSSCRCGAPSTPGNATGSVASSTGTPRALRRETGTTAAFRDESVTHHHLSTGWRDLMLCDAHPTGFNWQRSRTGRREARLGCATSMLSLVRSRHLIGASDLAPERAFCAPATRDAWLLTATPEVPIGALSDHAMGRGSVRLGERVLCVGGEQPGPETSARTAVVTCVWLPSWSDRRRAARSCPLRPRPQCPRKRLW